MEAVKFITQESVMNITRLDTLFYNKNKYNTNLYLQRGLIWTVKQQSLFIQSLLRNIKPPSITANNKNGIYNIVDGGNRLLTIFKFYENKLKIQENIAPVTIINMATGEIKIYEIANKTFNEFPVELQAHFNTRTLNIDIYDNLDDNVQSELLFLLNNGTPITGITKARINNYDTDLQELVKEITETELFTRKININNAWKEKFLHEQVIYNILAYECDILDNVSSNNYEKIGREIVENNLLTKEIQHKILEVIKYMDMVFPAKKKYLDTRNLIPIYRVCSLLMKIDVDVRETFNMIDGFFSADNEKYNSIKSNHWSAKSDNQKRYEMLKKYIDNCMKENKLA